MLCWFSVYNSNVPDYIEIRRKCKSKTSSLYGKLEHQTVNSQGNWNTVWKQEFSLYFEPGGISERVDIQYDAMNANSMLTGHVIISDEPEKSKENDEKKDTQLKSLNELSNDLTRLLDPKYISLADIHLKCGSDVIPAHKSILSVRSPIFLDIFSKEIENKVFIITDIEVPVFRFMVTYLYTGKIDNLTIPLVGDLFFAADKYKLKGLKTACCEYLKSNISFKNAVDILELGDLHDPDLKGFAIEFIRKECDKLQASERTKKLKTLQQEKSYLAFEVLTSLEEFTRNLSE
ncbi:hypothetical protein TNIN_170241 [Trichonephila inaurata madagascariensis]|uniref:BTB domain-containing protein n=1 Tax=Trichonephila inaurata madagascariensis TaxID=2747483 RepID=A0A8X7BU96_9ARAC|nr:hypothetical protein TNIN_170241 [Trichonephila inaurata madagascariensis]